MLKCVLIIATIVLAAGAVGNMDFEDQITEQFAPLCVEGNIVIDDSHVTCEYINNDGSKDRVILNNFRD